MMSQATASNLPARKEGIAILVAIIWSFAASSLSNGYKMNKKKSYHTKNLNFKDLKLTAKAEFSRSANSR